MSDSSRPSQPVGVGIELQPKVVAGIACWGVVVFLGAAIFCSLHGAYLTRVGEREQQVTGTIYAPGPWNHGSTYKYRFVPSGHGRFDGASWAPGDEPLAIGQPAIVYYDPKRPETNSLISFSEARPDYLEIAMYLCAAAAVGIYGVITWRRRPIR